MKTTLKLTATLGLLLAAAPVWAHHSFAAEFDDKKKLTLLDMVGLENRLSELLQVKVDLTPAETMKQHVRTTADKEAVLAF